MVNDLDYKDIRFLVSGKDFGQIEKKNNICINVFCYANNIVQLVRVSDQKFEECLVVLLMIANENRSQYFHVKYFNRFMCKKTKCNNRKHFRKYCLQCFNSEKSLAEHKETCLKINGKQRVKLKSGSIRFKTQFKQLTVPFKIYVDFESNLKRVKSSDRNNSTSFTKNIKHIFFAVLLIKLFVLMTDSANQLFFTEEKNVVYRFSETILEQYDFFKQVIKKHFSKNLVMSEKVEQIFQSSNKCWIRDKLFDLVDNKVTDHYHITGKYKGFTHQSCNINLKLTKKVPVIFYHLRGYESHLIISEIGKFDVKVTVIPNGLEKYMAFTININLVFIETMQFVNSSLDTLANYLTGNDFKYSSQEFSGDL